MKLSLPGSGSSVRNPASSADADAPASTEGEQARASVGTPADLAGSGASELRQAGREAEPDLETAATEAGDAAAGEELLDEAAGPALDLRGLWRDERGRLYLSMLVGAALLLAGGGVLLWFAPPPPGPTRTIRVAGADYLTEQEATRISGLQIGATPTDESLRAAERRLELHPAVRSASVERPDSRTVVLRLEERECAAIVRQAPAGATNQDDGASVLYEIDPNLAILSENRVRCKNTPIIQGFFAREADRFTDQTLERLVQGLQRLRKAYPELGARISEARLNEEGGLTLFLAPARARVEAPFAFDDEALKKLYAAVSYFERGGYRSGVIDLRGAEAVLIPAEP